MSKSVFQKRWVGYLGLKFNIDIYINNLGMSPMRKA